VADIVFEQQGGGAISEKDASVDVPGSQVPCGGIARHQEDSLEGSGRQQA
jgi:hypothetical protein